MQPAQASSQPATAEQPDCNPDCNRQDAENTKESEGGCKVAQDSEGSAGDNEEPSQIDLEEAIAAAVERDEREAIMAIDGNLEIPDFLRRGKAELS